MKVVILLVLPFIFQSPLPFKPDDEYELKLDYDFRNKPGISRFEIDDSNSKRYSGGTLPYLTVRIKMLALASGEKRVKVVTNKGQRIYSRKVSLDKPVEIEMGFTDDLKDHVTAHEFDVIYFSNQSEVSRINLFVEKGGTFLVNGNKRGKF